MIDLLADRRESVRKLYPVWEKQTIWQVFEKTCSLYPDATFVNIDGDGSYTYEQISEESLRLARGLSQLGIGSGSHVAVQLHNCHELILVCLALARLCAVKIPVNTSLYGEGLSYVIQQSDAEFCICKKPLEMDFTNSRVKKMICLQDAEGEYGVPTFSWNEVLTAGKKEVPLMALTSDMADLTSDIIYTSGSTSLPKGVLLTHDALLRSAYANCINRGFEVGRKVYIPLPMFHVYGYVEGFLACILTGGTVLLRDGKFTAASVVDFMLRAEANDILSVPAQMMALITYLKEHPTTFPHLHAVYCSASVCPQWVWPGIRQYLGVNDIITGYGMTEVCGASMQSDPCDSDEILESRVGRIIYDNNEIEYKLVENELYCRGVVVTKGYYNKPEVNAKAFTEDGWFKTGDAGYFDENGYMAMTGRVDDMYKINGENVSPKYIEEILDNCDVVSQVHVVGVRDEKHGFVGACFAQLKDDTPENRKVLEEYTVSHLANFQVPKYMYYMKESDWPCTSTGKVQKFRLREMIEGKN